MPGCRRQKIVRRGEIGVYHCWSRCVQPAFLCGQDACTGRDFDYRRERIERLNQERAALQQQLRDDTARRQVAATLNWRKQRRIGAELCQATSSRAEEALT